MGKLMLFNPEDFKQPNFLTEFIFNGSPSIEKTRAAEIANKILNDYIETLPKVCGNTTERGYAWLTSSPVCESHTARLICIEEIKPKICEHKMFRVREISCAEVDKATGQITGTSPYNEYICLDCNKILKPNWSVE